MSTRAHSGFAAAVLVLALAGEARPAPPPALVCKLQRDSTGTLPPNARHGIVGHLPQYPTLRLGNAASTRAGATRADAPGRRREARELARCGRCSASRLRHRHPPAREGRPDDLLLPRRAPRGASWTDGNCSDFARPKALIYANAPGRPLVLVGAMWSTRDGEVGPTPAGPILRWHSHVVCKEGAKRGLKPLAGGVPSRRATHAGCERDAARLVHGRTPERLRDHAPEARTVRTDSFPAVLRALGLVRAPR